MQEIRLCYVQSHMWFNARSRSFSGRCIQFCPMDSCLNKADCFPIEQSGYLYPISSQDSPSIKNYVPSIPTWHIASHKWSTAQLFKKWITYSLDKSLSNTAKVIPFDAFGEMSTQANDTCTFTFVLYKFHIATASFSYIFHLMLSTLSTTAARLCLFILFFFLVCFLWWGGYLLDMGHLLKRGINSISWNRYREWNFSKHYYRAPCEQSPPHRGTYQITVKLAFIILLRDSWYIEKKLSECTRKSWI